MVSRRFSRFRCISVVLVLPVCVIPCGELFAGVSFATIFTTGSVNPDFHSSDTLWTINEQLIIGYHAEGTLTVTDGSDVVANGTVFVGDFNDLYGDATGGLLLTGAGSTLSVDPAGESELFIGPFAAGSVTVTSLASLISHDSVIGGSVLAGDGDVTIRGGGTWTAERLEIGAAGAGALTIEDAGSSVSADIVVMGLAPDSTAQVDVNEGSFTVAQDLTVGAWGDGTLTISNGGAVLSDSVILGGSNPLYATLAEYLDPNANLGAGTGTAMVDGAGSAWQATDMYVGFSGAGSLTISADGRVRDASGWIGLMPDAVGVATVTDANWVNDDHLNVGVWGQGALTIAGGGMVRAGEVYIGGTSFHNLEADYDPDLVPDGMGQITVTGSGSELSVVGWDTLYVGYSGAGSLDVNDGGAVTTRSAIIGASSDAEGAVTIDNGTFSASSDVVVGAWGEGYLVLSGGGQATMDSLFIGGMDVNDAPAELAENLGDPAGFGSVEVAGDGSLLEVADGQILHVGYSGGAELYIRDGGQVISRDSYIGTTPGSNAQVGLDDATWTNDGDLFLGRRGMGILMVRNGGQMTTSGSAYLGSTAEGLGGAILGGEGSRWEIAGSAYVGGDALGGSGQGILVVTDGAEVWIHDELYIWADGALGGNATITVAAPTTLHNYGTISPTRLTDDIGVLTVNGDVVFHEASTYVVDINNAGSDRLVVNGDVTIDGGAVQLQSEGTILGEHEYEILTADSVVGEFNDLDTALLTFSFSDAGLDYNDTSIWLHVTAANFDDPNVVRTDNQTALGRVLQTIGDRGGNDVTDAVQDIPTGDDLRAAYDQLSGQTRPSLAPMTIAGSSKFLGTVASRIQNVQTGLVAGAFDGRPFAAAGPDQASGGSVSQEAAPGRIFAVGNGSQTLAERRWGLWGRSYGLFGDRDSEGGVPGYGYDVYGGSFGVDYQVTEGFLAGIVGGLSEGDADFDSSRDNTDFDAAHIGLYGSLARGPWFVDSVVTYAGLDYETERFVDVLDERLTGNFDGSEFAAYVEASRNFDLSPRLRLAPLASLQYTYVHLDSYTESGGVGALTFDEQTHESVRGSLGARLTRRLIESTGDFCADLQLRGRWVHEFGDDRASVDSSFASDPTVVFTLRDAEVSRDSAILGTGLSAQIGKRTRAYLDYDARLNSDESLQVLSASLQYRW